MRSQSLTARFAVAGAMLVMLPALGGCQAFGGRSAALVEASDLREPLSANFAARQLAEGREALDRGHTAEAIDSFMLARLDHAHAAAAYNGLAVAYSRLGRTDLTERFFQVAVALAPDDDRYRANLALFYINKDRLAGAASAEVLTASPRPSPSSEPSQRTAGTSTGRAGAPRNMGRGLVAEASSSQLRRISSREVVVGGSSRPAALVMTATRRPAVIEVGARSVQAYPIRLTLSHGRASAPAALRPYAPGPRSGAE